MYKLKDTSDIKSKEKRKTDMTWADSMFTQSSSNWKNGDNKHLKKIHLILLPVILDFKTLELSCHIRPYTPIIHVISHESSSRVFHRMYSLWSASMHHVITWTCHREARLLSKRSPRSKFLRLASLATRSQICRESAWRQLQVEHPENLNDPPALLVWMM